MPFSNAPTTSLPRRYAFFTHIWPAILVSLAILAAILLPTPLLVSQRFHHDEALYSTWALQIVSGADPWLAQTPVDKPPLYLYTLAGAMNLLGTTETAARIPSLLAMAVTVGLTFWLGRILYGHGVGVIAAWLVALSPFTLLFAPTAFTDPLLVMFVLAACVAAAQGRAGWAGLWLGLAIATKQQGVFFLPLVIGLLIINEWPRSVANGEFEKGGRQQITRITLYALRFILTLSLTLLPVIVWDLTRQAPDFLTHSAVNYGGLTPDTADFGERWWGFVELLHYATASPVLNVIFGVGLPLLLLYGLMTGDRRPETGTNSPPHSSAIHHSPFTIHHSLFSPAPPPPLSPQADWLLTLFVLAFLLGHALFSFQVWDRYLLGLIPLLALLLARILLLPWSIFTQTNWAKIANNISPPKRQNFSSPNPLIPAKTFREGEGETRANSAPRRLIAGAIYGLALAVLLAVTLTGPVRDTVNGRYPLGSHSQALSGIEQIVAYLQGHIGANHTLYHRWLGTHWRFYLWGYPYDLRYWASPQELAASAQPGHLIVFPSWQSDTEARLALAQAGLELRELARAYHPAGYPALILYEIVDGKR